jgi:hypothetical protein
MNLTIKICRVDGGKDDGIFTVSMEFSPFTFAEKLSILGVASGGVMTTDHHKIDLSGAGSSLLLIENHHCQGRSVR